MVDSLMVETNLTLFFIVNIKGHLALVKCEEDFLKKNKKFTLITQNVDGLHLKAGTKNIIQMHGNILETRCTVCKKVEHNLDM